MLALEDVAAAFWRQVALGARQMPAQVWHYSNPDGVAGILESERLWLKTSTSQADRQEIHWGNGLVAQAAREVRTELGGHPALDLLLDDPTATMFASQTEIFLACFTDEADTETQWGREGCREGAALVFDAASLSRLLRLSETGGSGLVPVSYDDDHVLNLSRNYFRAVTTLSKFGGQFQNDAAEYWKLVAQYLMEPGGLAFYCKRRGYQWEKELRIVRRAFVSPKHIQEDPRRVEQALRGAVQPLKSIVLGPAIAASDEHRIRSLAETWNLPVSRSTCL